MKNSLNIGEVEVKPSSPMMKTRTFPQNKAFPQNFGRWTLITQKNKRVESDKLEDLKGIPGLFIENDSHYFGYKFNRLYESWRPYNFEKRREL